MSVITKDNIEFAAAMLWFVEHPVFKKMEDKSAYIHAILEFFRVSTFSLIFEVNSQSREEELREIFLGSIGENPDYLVLSALGHFIVNEDYRPTDDDYKYYERIEAIFKTPASKMKRPNVENCIPEFTRLHTHWLDWFIRRNPPEASEKYGIIAPCQMTTDQKARWRSWVQKCWVQRDSTEAKEITKVFDKYIYGDGSPSLRAAIRGALQKQQQSLARMRSCAPPQMRYQ